MPANPSEKINLKAQILEIIAIDIDPRMLENPRRMLAAISGQIRLTVNDIDLEMLRTVFMNVDQPTQGIILDLIEKLDNIISAEMANLYSQCSRYKSLLRIMPIDVLVSIIRELGCLEELCITSPWRLKKLIQEHPLVRQAENKERASRLVSCKGVLAARDDCYGSGETDFSIKIKESMDTAGHRQAINKKDKLSIRHGKLMPVIKNRICARICKMAEKDAGASSADIKSIRNIRPAKSVSKSTKRVPGQKTLRRGGIKCRMKRQRIEGFKMA